MAKKAFEIQSSDLIIGGVNLQAGTTGVVIPGVTQAANYRVEEVEDTDVDQTHVFAANNEVVVVDFVLYNAIVNEATENLYADFTATTDDDGEIDEIEVNGQGTYTSQQATDNAANNMYAYVGAGSASDRPLVPEDWIQIPFRPKMRAGEVENVGGVGGSLTVGNGTGTSIQNVTEILINGEITQVDDGVVGITIAGGSGLTDITGDQIGNQITISTTIDGATPDLENTSAIEYIPTTTLEENNWIVTSDPGTYSSVRFADGSTFVITGWNTDAYPNTGNGTSGFLTLDASGLNYLGAQVWPITITSYDYVASTVPGKGIEIDGSVWKFDGNFTLTVPGEIQSNNYNNLVLRSNDNINLYAGDAPGDDSEGGDINIEAGQGDPGNGGGDVQIRGGNGGNLSNEFDTGNSGGYVQLQGGYSSGSNSGGYVELRGGSSARGQGGRVDITGGYGSDDMLKLANVAITDIILNTPVQVTLAVDHNLNDGDAISFANILTTVQLNNTKYYTYLIDNNTIDLYQDRELTMPVSGAGMTAYLTPGVATETFTNANGLGNNTFSQYISSAPTIGNIQVGWTVTGPGLNGTKTVTAINPEDPVNITVDGNDGSVFINTETYTFTEPSTTGLGTAYSSAHGGDINLEPGGTLNSGWGDIGRTLIRGETQIGNNGGNIWKFGVDGSLTFPGGAKIETAYGGDTRLLVEGADQYVDIRSSTGILIGSNSTGTVTIGSSGSSITEIVSGKVVFINQAVPEHSYGAAGDQIGQVAFDSSYIYYCTQNYAGNSTNVTTLASTSSFVWVSSADYAGDLVADFTGNSTGWTYNGVTIVSIIVDNQFGPGYLLEAVTSFGVFNDTDYALVSPIVPNIWKRVAWSGDTW